MMKFYQWNISVLIIINLCFLPAIYSKKTDEENVCKKQDNTLKISDEQVITDLFTNYSK